MSKLNWANNLASNIKPLGPIDGPIEAFEQSFWSSKRNWVNTWIQPLYIGRLNHGPNSKEVAQVKAQVEMNWASFGLGSGPNIKWALVCFKVPILSLIEFFVRIQLCCLSALSPHLCSSSYA